MKFKLDVFLISNKLSTILLVFLLLFFPIDFPSFAPNSPFSSFSTSSLIFLNKDSPINFCSLFISINHLDNFSCIIDVIFSLPFIINSLPFLYTTDVIGNFFKNVLNA